MSSSELSHAQTKGLGIEIALLGIDGIGKSTVAAELAARLSAAREIVEMNSWRRHLSPSPQSQHQAFATSLWTSMVRCLYGTATLANGSMQLEHMPNDISGYFDAIARGRFSDEPITANRANALLAAAAIENAAAILFRKTTVEGPMEAGHVVIHESHAVKSVVKELVLAARAGHLSPLLTDALVDSLTVPFLDAIKPTVSILLWGSVETSLKWRLRQKAKLGPMEHFGLVGLPAEETYVEFEELVQAQLMRLADIGGWIKVEMTDQPIERNVSAVIDALNEHAGFRGVLTR